MVVELPPGAGEAAEVDEAGAEGVAEQAAEQVSDGLGDVRRGGHLDEVAEGVAHDGALQEAPDELRVDVGPVDVSHDRDGGGDAIDLGAATSGDVADAGLLLLVVATGEVVELRDDLLERDGAAALEGVVQEVAEVLVGVRALVAGHEGDRAAVERDGDGTLHRSAFLLTFAGCDQQMLKCVSL